MNYIELSTLKLVLAIFKKYYSIKKTIINIVMCYTNFLSDNTGWWVYFSNSCYPNKFSTYTSTN